MFLWHSKKNFTKEKAVKVFKTLLEISTIPKHDKIAIREAWGVYTDYLCKAGFITLKKYNSWSNPF